MNQHMDTGATSKYTNMKECELNYSLKRQPVMTVGKIGKAFNKLKDARGISLDELNQLIYIVDRGSRRVQVLTFEGNFITNFGQGILEDPWGIAVTENYVFVTDRALHQFSDYNVVITGTGGKEEGGLSNPHGLCVDYNGDVYVADCLNNRITIFSKFLKFLKCFGAGELKYVGDVKVTPDCIVVLDQSPNCIHFYSRSGHLINSCVSHGRDGIVYQAWFFCLDPLGNILISDSILNDIKIISPSGQLTHTIIMDMYQSAWGICISKLGTIFVIARKENLCLQSF